MAAGQILSIPRIIELMRAKIDEQNELVVEMERLFLGPTKRTYTKRQHAAPSNNGNGVERIESVPFVRTVKKRKPVAGLFDGPFRRLPKEFTIEAFRTYNLPPVLLAQMGRRGFIKKMKSGLYKKTAKGLAFKSDAAPERRL